MGWGIGGLCRTKIRDYTELWAFFKQLPPEASLSSSEKPGVDMFLFTSGVGTLSAAWQVRPLGLTPGQGTVAVPRPGHPVRLPKSQEGLVGVCPPTGSILVP